MLSLFFNLWPLAAKCICRFLSVQPLVTMMVLMIFFQLGGEPVLGGPILFQFLRNMCTVYLASGSLSMVFLLLYRIILSIIIAIINVDRSGTLLLLALFLVSHNGMLV